MYIHTYIFLKRKEKSRGAGKSKIVVFIIGSSQRFFSEDQVDQVRSTMTEQACSLMLEGFQPMAGVSIVQGWKPE